MTPCLVFHPAARDELREARDWYEAQREGLGNELGEVIGATLARVAKFPELYPEIVPGLRRAVLSRFPYAFSIAGARSSPQSLRSSPSSITGAIRRSGADELPYNVRCTSLAVCGSSLRSR